MSFAPLNDDGPLTKFQIAAAIDNDNIACVANDRISFHGNCLVLWVWDAQITFEQVRYHFFALCTQKRRVLGDE